ncbi:MAG: fructose-bisphosphatase class II family protein, partial [Patescibacteria group bacterium]|nr:fructose-bisphosphatase class II family protein [Patescibacteria group bacterium]
VDPLENTSATAKLNARAICVLAASEKGGLFHGPEMYMDKLIVGREAKGKVCLDDKPKKNLKAIAKALKREVRDLVIVILDRERHEELVAKVREAGARVKLVSGGDLTPGIAACMRGTGVHAVMGIGGAPEGVLTAAAMRCLGGQIQGRFWPKNKEQGLILKKMKMDREKIYSQDELASGKDIIFCASGVTTGDILKGVRFFGGGARTHTLVMSTKSGKIRFVDTTHVFNKKEIDYRL